MDNVNFSHDPTLCWDCANATRPWRCEWVSEFKPVEGWTAHGGIVSRRSSPFHSYHVIKCPKFQRDSYCGGLVAEDGNAKTHLDNNDVINLAEAIVERQIADWKELDFGLLSTYHRNGTYIKRKDVIAFFHSPWCAQLMQEFTAWTPAKLREWLKIPPLSSI